MNLQGCRMVAGCLADHHGLDKITHDRHQALLGVLVGIVAGEEDQLADTDLNVGRIELRLQLRNFLLKILGRRFRGGELKNQLLARHFQFVELVIQDDEAWAAFGNAVVTLLHEARLF
ncbi:hypothetical protein [Rhizobium ruizarguesonis]|uniref:hypothetical protein n=1 Tax=Rhizobium ruizarguesonis TaxID=2081791 RepID=UPI001FE0651F|nr:hypothetical protein [Rhizobium ruizarguesonis]